MGGACGKSEKTDISDPITIIEIEKEQKYGYLEQKEQI